MKLFIFVCFFASYFEIETFNVVAYIERLLVYITMDEQGKQMREYGKSFLMKFSFSMPEDEQHFSSLIARIVRELG